MLPLSALFFEMKIIFLAWTHLLLSCWFFITNCCNYMICICIFFMGCLMKCLGVDLASKMELWLMSTIFSFALKEVASELLQHSQEVLCFLFNVFSWGLLVVSSLSIFHYFFFLKEALCKAESI